MLGQVSLSRRQMRRTHQILSGRKRSDQTDPFQHRLCLCLVLFPNNCGHIKSPADSLFHNQFACFFRLHKLLRFSSKVPPFCVLWGAAASVWMRATNLVMCFGPARFLGSCLYYTQGDFDRKVRTSLWYSYREETIGRLPKGNNCAVMGFSPLPGEKIFRGEGRPLIWPTDGPFVHIFGSTAFTL